MPTRCPNGTFRNKKTGLCEKKQTTEKKSKCKKGTRRNTKTGNCEPIYKTDNVTIVKKTRCKKGTRRNTKTGNCDPVYKNEMNPSVEEKKGQTFPKKMDEDNMNLQNNILVESNPPFLGEDKRAKQIQQFMLQNKNKIRALFLNTICSDSGSCIALGTNADKIKQFFGGFVDFAYLNNVAKIGKTSANGKVYQLEYTHRNYHSHAIMKMNSRFGSDSLLYEYFVGIRVNHYTKYFPSFLETYGSYTIDPIIKDESPITKLELERNFHLNPPDIHDLASSCNMQYHQKYAVLIQHLKVTNGFETLRDCINNTVFRNFDLAPSLYQIYSTLSCLVNVYTHYDLHSDNVMMYIPNDDKYIEYHYHNKDGTTTTFKSKYIVKIIDYGRNYIHVDGIREDSNTFYKILCGIDECSKPGKCGEKYGYQWLQPSTRSNYFIASSQKNMSHDLRLLHTLSSKHNMLPDLATIFSKVVYDTKFGTKEIKSSGLPTHINNVKDMEISLRNYMHTHNQKINNDYRYSKKTKLGDLHIYMDMGKPMKYVSA